jgi:hypothetical protein
MAARSTSRAVGSKENLFGFLTEKKVTYHRDVAKERKSMRADEIADRKHKLALKQLAAAERAADAKIAAASKKIAAAEKTIDQAEGKSEAGKLTLADFEAIKKRNERVIEEEKQKAAAARERLREQQSKTNPAVTAAQYRLAQAVLSGTARVSMPRSVAQEIVDRTPAAKRSEFMKANPGPKSYIGHKFSEFEVQYRKSSGDAWGKWSTYAYKRMADDVVKRLRTEGKQARVVVVKRNPASYPHSVQTATGREYFKDIGSANAKAQAEADRTGRTVARKDASGGSSLFYPRKANPKTYGAYASEPQAIAALKKSRKRGGYVGFDGGKNKWVLIFPHEGKSLHKGNPAEDAQALSRKFHGRKATTTDRVVETLYEHKHLMKIGPLVRLVIDTPTGLVAMLNFDVKNPQKVVELATSERDPKTGKLVGKQLYLRGGDQEINLAAIQMDSALWIRDKMELGRLHEFKRGDRLIVDASGKMRHAKPGERAKADEQEIRGSITYQTRKGMDDFQLINYWHRAGEETSRKYGPAARALVVYDYPNKKIEFVGGQYVVDSPGIIN